MLFRIARRMMPPVAAAAVVGATATAARAQAGGEKTAGTDDGVEWAWPSPYHAGVDSGARFRQARRFRRRREEWDLAALLAVWTENDGEETWPWVWTWRNENGPHHVFVGVDGQTLDRCRRVAAASPQNNLTLILPPEHPLLLPAADVHRREGGDKGGKCGGEGSVQLADFYACRCAVVESRPAQIDFAEKVLMLEDERIICYSALTLT
jgi:hypothetical protein